MAWFVVGILVFLVKCSSSMECPGCSVFDSLIESFNDKAVTDFVLSEFGGASKLMDCVFMCSRDIRCRSYRHNVQTETCSTYGAGYSLPEKTLNPVTLEVGSRLYAMCGEEHAFGSSCLPGDCNYGNGLCDDGVCGCPAGGVFTMETETCSNPATTPSPALMIAMSFFGNPGLPAPIPKI